MCTNAKPHAIAIVPAAGGGQRMGLGRSKGLLEIAGKPAIERTVEALKSSNCIDHVVVMTRDFEASEFHHVLQDRNYVSVVTGGATRQESVRRGLDYLSLKYQDPHKLLVLVHDAARCLVSPGLISRCVEAAAECGAVTAAIPQSDSLKRVRADMQVESSLSREGVYAVQTPQVFRFDLLFGAHQSGVSGATDDASLVETIHPVTVVMGERYNLKITTQEDLALARAITNSGLHCTNGNK